MIIISKDDKIQREYLVNYLRSSMERGVKIEIPEEEKAMAHKRQQDALGELQRTYGIDNPNSHVQLKRYAETYGSPQMRSIITDPYTGKMSFAAENIAKLLEIDDPFASVFKRYQDATSLLKNINMIGDWVKDGYVHPKVSLQNSNRISYTEPAIMNISKAILWNMIKSRNEGWELWSVDVKNQEPWIFAHLMNDETLKGIVQNTYMRKESFYKIVFEHVYGRPVANEYEYSEIKVGWNMLTYGGTKEGLKAQCKVIDGLALYKFFTGIKAFREYTAKNRSLAYHGVNTLTTYFGSQVFSDKTGTNALARSLADIVIQGTGADILAQLVYNIVRDIDETPEFRNRIEIYYTRHDEIIFMVKRNAGETDEDIIEMLHTLTDHMIVDWVPFMTDIEKIG